MAVKLSVKTTGRPRASGRPPKGKAVSVKRGGKKMTKVKKY